MALNLPLYQSALKARDTIPYDYYKNFQQALIDSKWINTTTLTTVEEQVGLGIWEFYSLEVHLNHAIAESAKSFWEGNDVRKINFRNLDHDIARGLYYRFDNNYFIATFTDEANRLTKDVVVRRCNNWLRWIDEETGELKEYPCILNYDATSPQTQIDNDIKTPNNATTIIVQGNLDTKTIKTNQRFIFMGEDRVWKIAGHNKYLMDNLSDDTASIMYFDAYLDEISPYDDFVNHLANNSEYDNIIGTESGNQVEPVGQPYIKITPYVESLTQRQSVVISANLIDENGNQLTDRVYCDPSNANPKSYILEYLDNNQFKLTNVKMDSKPLGLKFYSGEISENIVVLLKALF